MKPEPRQYNQSYLNTAVLLEGKFESLYKNRLAPEIEKDTAIAFKERADKPGKMVVIADGDIISNDFQKGRPLACGYDRFSGTFFGNRSFIQNIVDYLSDDGGLLTVRSKEFKIRMLDPQIIEDKQQMIKLLNCVLPVLLVLFFGIFKSYSRKRKFA